MLLGEAISGGSSTTVVRPNAYAKTVEIGPHTRKIVIIALKDIKAGEEVMYDSKFPIEDDKIPCYCGAPGCKGTMN